MVDKMKKIRTIVEKSVDVRSMQGKHQKLVELRRERGCGWTDRQTDR